MNKMIAGYASLAIVALTATPTLGVRMVAPEGFTIKTSFSNGAPPTKEDVLSLPNLGEGEKKRIKAIYAGFEAKYEAMEKLTRQRPENGLQAAEKQRQDLERKYKAKIMALLSPKELETLINPYQLGRVRNGEATSFRMPTKNELGVIPHLEEEKKAQLEALIADYQTQLKPLDAESRLQFGKYNDKIRAWHTDLSRNAVRMDELSQSTWKEVSAILTPEQIKVLQPKDQVDPYIPSKQEIVFKLKLTPAQTERMQAIYGADAAQSSKLADAWSETNRSEWSEIKSKLTAQQTETMPPFGPNPPWIYWEPKENPLSGKAQGPQYELKLTRIVKQPTFGGGKPPTSFEPKLDSKQVAQIKEIIEDYRIRYAGLQRQTEDLRKSEWLKLKPILTKEQLTTFWQSRNLVKLGYPKPDSGTTQAKK